MMDLLSKALIAHLDSWGLKRFTSDADYFAWQRRVLSPAELNSLHHHVEQKRRGMAADEVAFYDVTADPKILPVLYSQRYDYYQQMGLRVASRMADAHSVLDFGCGVGILTTFYARQFPEKRFTGIDRSSISIARAREKAKMLDLPNVRFECLDVTQATWSGSYDVIVATHALVQAEQDTGLASRDWTTFERTRDVERQQAFEERTGIGPRLARLCASLAPSGRMIVFEKTRPLARRVPFQRALASHGLSLEEPPELIQYALVEEIADDGPLYVLRKGEPGKMGWDEAPEPDEGHAFDPEAMKRSPLHPGGPLYENHYPSAQQIWHALHGRSLIKEVTREEPDGRQLHVELGLADEGMYLYCANTFDQRQLVIVKMEQRGDLEQYYEEIVSSAS